MLVKPTFAKMSGRTWVPYALFGREERNSVDANKKGVEIGEE